jgi:hypothetical protein
MHHADPIRAWQEGPHDYAVLHVVVHTEEREGVAVGRSNDPLDVVVEFLPAHTHRFLPFPSVDYVSPVMG